MTEDPAVVAHAAWKAAEKEMEALYREQIAPGHSSFDSPEAYRLVQAREGAEARFVCAIATTPAGLKLQADAAVEMIELVANKYRPFTHLRTLLRSIAAGADRPA